MIFPLHKYKPIFGWPGSTLAEKLEHVLCLNRICSEVRVCGEARITEIRIWMTSCDTNF